MAAARRFLEGDTEPAIGQLLDAMRRAERSLQFEQALRCRDDAEFCRRFATHQRFLSRFSTAPVAIRDRDIIHPWSYLFHGGHLVCSRALALPAQEMTAAASAASAASVEQVTSTPRAPLEAWAMAGRAGVVRRWLAGTETAEYLDLGANGAAATVSAAAEHPPAAPDTWLPGRGLAISARRARQPRRRAHPQPR